MCRALNGLGPVVMYNYNLGRFRPTIRWQGDENQMACSSGHHPTPVFSIHVNTVINIINQSYMHDVWTCVLCCPATLLKKVRHGQRCDAEPNAARELENSNLHDVRFGATDVSIGNWRSPAEFFLHVCIPAHPYALLQLVCVPKELKINAHLRDFIRLHHVVYFYPALGKNTHCCIHTKRVNWLLVLLLWRIPTWAVSAEKCLDMNVHHFQVHISYVVWS